MDVRGLIENIIVGLVTGLISGGASGYIVYLITKKREEKYQLFCYWHNYLFKALDHCKMRIPIEELQYLSKIGGKGTVWHNAMYEIFDCLNPYGHENTEFSDEQTRLSENVFIALKELYRWGTENKVKP